MQSSPFVKVTFADPQKVLGQIRKYVRETVAKRPEVLRVILFGSYSTDRYAPRSDVDLLWVIKDSRKRFLDRIPDYLPDSLPLAMDVFPYTTAELEKMIAANNPLIRRALLYGQVLFERHELDLFGSERSD